MTATHTFEGTPASGPNNGKTLRILQLYPLDMNLTRLLTIFKELQETSQLIVITHQKRTMEIADALYGVTMRDGITRVVSQRLAD